MGKVSYKFSCGWHEPTISTEDILWAKYNNEWKPFKVKQILIEYNSKFYDYLQECNKAFYSHAVFKCVLVDTKVDCKYEVNEYCSEFNTFINVDEKDIGLTVFLRNPDESIEEYYKRIEKRQKSV